MSVVVSKLMIRVTEDCCQVVFAGESVTGKHNEEVIKSLMLVVLIKFMEFGFDGGFDGIGVDC